MRGTNYYDSDEEYGLPSAGLFDGPPYYPSYGSVQVDLPRGPVHVSQGQLLSIFPGIASRMRGSARLDGYILATEIARRLSKPRGIDFNRVVEVLAYAFQALLESEQGYRDFLSCIGNILQGELVRDVRYPSYARGLFRSHSMFAILATLAKLTGSSYLASALARFLYSHQAKIISCENEKHITSWGLSVMDLQNLADEVEAANCFIALVPRLEDIRNSWRWRRYYDQRLFHLVQILESFLGGWGVRGRRPIRPLIYGVPRANTMPPPIIHRPPPLILPPPMPLSTYAPSPPMELALPNPYVQPALEEHLDHLGRNQAEIQNNQLQLMDNQEDLHHGQNCIENHLSHHDHRLARQDHHIVNQDRRLEDQEYRQDYLENKIEDLAQQLQY